MVNLIETNSQFDHPGMSTKNDDARKIKMTTCTYSIENLAMNVVKITTYVRHFYLLGSIARMDDE